MMKLTPLTVIRSLLFWAIAVLPGVTLAADAGWQSATFTFHNKTKYAYDLNLQGVTGCPSKGFQSTVTVPADSTIQETGQVEFVDCFDTVVFTWNFKLYGFLGVPVEYQTWTYSIDKFNTYNKIGSFRVSEQKPVLQTVRGGRMSVDAAHCGEQLQQWCGGERNIGESYDLDVRVIWVPQTWASIQGYANGARRH